MRGVLTDDLARDPGEVDRQERPERHAGFEPREVEKLLYQPPNALGALPQLLQSGSARRRRLRTLRELGLERDGRHRRAQLMRRVGEKAPLRIERCRQTPEERVDLVDEGCELARHAVGREWIQTRHVAVTDRARCLAERREAAR